MATEVRTVITLWAGDVVPTGERGPETSVTEMFYLLI